jgi:hypothetical protein
VALKEVLVELISDANTTESGHGSLRSPTKQVESSRKKKYSDVKNTHFTSNLGSSTNDIDKFLPSAAVVGVSKCTFKVCGCARVHSQPFAVCYEASHLRASKLFCRRCSCPTGSDLVAVILLRFVA